jgi:hypothetical protein
VAQLALLDEAVKIVAYWTVATNVGRARGHVMLRDVGETLSGCGDPWASSGPVGGVSAGEHAAMASMAADHRAAVIREADGIDILGGGGLA